MLEIVYGLTSQTLGHYPALRVTSATYVISDLRYGEDSAEHELASGSATVDSLSTTTDAACGFSTATPRRVPVTSTAGFVVGREYEITGTDGMAERFTVERTVSGDAVYATAALLGEYASGAAVRGLLVSASFPDDAAADETLFDSDYPARIVWAYTRPDGTAYRAAEQIRLVRTHDADLDSASIARDIQENWPELVKAMPEGGAALLDRHIAYARARVRSRMVRNGIEPDEFMAGDQLRQVVMLRTLLHLADQGFVPGNRDAETFRGERRDEFAGEIESMMLGRAGARTVDLDRQSNDAKAPRSEKFRSFLEPL